MSGTTIATNPYLQKLKTRDLSQPTKLTEPGFVSSVGYPRCHVFKNSASPKLGALRKSSRSLSIAVRLTLSPIAGNRRWRMAASSWRNGTSKPPRSAGRRKTCSACTGCRTSRPRATSDFAATTKPAFAGCYAVGRWWRSPKVQPRSKGRLAQLLYTAATISRRLVRLAIRWRTCDDRLSHGTPCVQHGRSSEASSQKPTVASGLASRSSSRCLGPALLQSPRTHKNFRRRRS